MIDEYKEVEEIESSDLVVEVECSLTQTETKEDLHGTDVLQTFVRLEDKECQVIIDSGSCVNTISTSTVETLGVITVPHSNSFKASWIDSISMTIKPKCQILIQLQPYQRGIWSNVPPMGVSKIILGRPWLYDPDTILLGLPNPCAFRHHGKSIMINPTPSKDDIKRGFTTLTEETSDLNLINIKRLEKELSEGATDWVLVVKSIKEHPPDAKRILIEFSDGFPDEVPVPDPPWRDIGMDFVLGLPEVQKSPPRMIHCNSRALFRGFLIWQIPWP